MTPDTDRSASQSGYVHEDTIRSFSMVWFAGMFIGSGITILLSRTGYFALAFPTTAPMVAVVGGVLVTWIALKTLPDARTIATRVEECEIQ